RDEGPELDPAGHGGDGAHEGPRLPGPARVAVGPAVQEVLAQPDRVEAEVLDGPDEVEQLRPADLALDLGELDADLDRALGHRCRPGQAPSAAAIARRWSGVEPQHAPTM